MLRRCRQWLLPGISMLFLALPMSVPDRFVAARRVDIRKADIPPVGPITKKRVASRVPILLTADETHAVRTGRELELVLLSDPTSGVDASSGGTETLSFQRCDPNRVRRRLSLLRCDDGSVPFGGMTVPSDHESHLQSPPLPLPVAVPSPPPVFNSGCTGSFAQRTLADPELIARQSVCCNHRIQCYMTAASDKYSCDNQFYVCMRNECGGDITCRAQAFLYFKAVARGACYQWQKIRKHYGCTAATATAMAVAPLPELTDEIRETKVLIHYPMSDPTNAEMHAHYYGVRAAGAGEEEE